MLEKKSWFKECFNTKGRWNRKKFWLYPLGLGLITLVPMFLLAFLLGKFAPSTLEAISGILIIIWYVPMIYVSVLSYMKRLRDLNKNPWMTLLMVVPLVSLGLLIYCGFWKGTSGENKYGPDPLGSTEAKKIDTEDVTKIEKTEEL